jgi:catechol 2,3-dioxygenase-like lactoylglutathione lyase family enzyme
MRLDHVVFPVRDPVSTLRFYRQVLRLPLVQTLSGPDWGGFPWLMLIFALPSGQEIVCVCLRGAPPPDYRTLPSDARHYAIALDSRAEFDAWRARVADLGVASWEEDHGDQWSLYFPDPDGVVLELTWPASTPRQAEDPAAVRAAEAWAAQ